MKRTCFVAMAALALAIPARTALAQQKAYAVPISNKVVKLEVLVPEGRWIKAMVQEGGQLRVEDHGLNLTMAFVPVIQESGVRVRTFKIEKHAGGNESMHFIENIDVRMGDTGFTKKATGSFSVRALGIWTPPEESGREGAPAKSASQPAG